MSEVRKWVRHFHIATLFNISCLAGSFSAVLFPLLEPSDQSISNKWLSGSTTSKFFSRWGCSQVSANFLKCSLSWRHRPADRYPWLRFWIWLELGRVRPGSLRREPPIADCGSVSSVTEVTHRHVPTPCRRFLLVPTPSARDSLACRCRVR